MMAAQDLVAQEIEECANEAATRRIKYPLSEKQGHRIDKNLSLATLHMMTNQMRATADYHSPIKEEQAPCGAFVESYTSKCEATDQKGQNLRLL